MTSSRRGDCGRRHALEQGADGEGSDGHAVLLVECRGRQFGLVTAHLRAVAALNPKAQAEQT